MKKASETDLHRRVKSVRAFNRFYTRQIGLLNERLYESEFSLTEIRVLYELSRRTQTTATALRGELGLDAGYLSRMLQRFERKRLVGRKPSDSDGRQILLSLTAKGREAFVPLDVRANAEVASMLEKLSVPKRERLIEAMNVVQELLGSREQKFSYHLRRHRLEDMGWVVRRHGLFYGQEYGYDKRYEALVASIVAAFMENYDPRRERCWIAEDNGEPIGCVFLVKKSETVAQLRLLFVETAARGLGLGTRLVNECVRFAKETGYQKVELWTQSELRAARHIYKKAGFHLVDTKRHRSWGRELMGETWELVFNRNSRGRVGAADA